MLQTLSDGTTLLRALLVGLVHAGQTTKGTDAAAFRKAAFDSLSELAMLADSCGIAVVQSETAQLRETNPRFLLGAGKAAELSELAVEVGCDLIILDEPLSPVQQRNWEELSGIAVIDREELILDIFRHRAHTKEAMVQVELARLAYSLPRLRRAWVHLGRQRGGRYGTKGEGETQLELDRRRVMNRIATLQKELKKLELQHQVASRRRERSGIFHVALVGYTNAGKSSLFNRLCKADAYADNRLFATLDPATRRASMPNGAKLIFTDTVGFIRKLPHHLFDAFKATLRSAAQADLLLHVIDAADERSPQLAQTTLEVLHELGADSGKMLTVLNKVDALADRSALTFLEHRFPGSLQVSALTGEGLPALLEELSRQASPAPGRC